MAEAVISLLEADAVRIGSKLPCFSMTLMDSSGADIEELGRKPLEHFRVPGGIEVHPPKRAKRISFGPAKRNLENIAYRAVYLGNVLVCKAALPYASLLKGGTYNFDIAPGDYVLRMDVGDQ